MENQYIYQLVSLVLLIAAALIFFIIPEQRSKKKKQEALANLKVGDKIITKGGLNGKVNEVKEDSVIISLSNSDQLVEVMLWGIEEVEK